MLVARRVALLLALWLLFECWISWVATCQPSNQRAADYIADRDICTLSTGPVVSTVSYMLVGLARFLHTYEHQLVAGFTIVLAAFTGTLWWSTRRLWLATREMVAGGDKLADIAEKQMLITAQQTDIQKKQHAIGRLQFIADKRPRLRVRHVILHPDIKNKIGDPVTVVKGSLVVVNIGGTDATIVHSRYRVFFDDEFSLPMDLDLEGEESFPIADGDFGPIKGGESCTYPFRAARPLGDNAEDVEMGNVPLFVVGHVRYSDINGTERFMGFCRRYAPADGGRGDRFLAVDDPDYEYED